MIELKLTPEEMQIIRFALGRIPHDDVAPVIAEIGRQIAEQQKPAEPAET